MGLMRESRKENGAVNESYQKAFFSLMSKTHHWTLHESHLRFKGLMQESP
jgi:hypothetical protein